MSSEKIFPARSQSPRCRCAIGRTNQPSTINSLWRKYISEYSIGGSGLKVSVPFHFSLKLLWSMYHRNLECLSYFAVSVWARPKCSPFLLMPFRVALSKLNMTFKNMHYHWGAHNGNTLHIKPDVFFIFKFEIRVHYLHIASVTSLRNVFGLKD